MATKKMPEETPANDTPPKVTPTVTVRHPHFKDITRVVPADVVERWTSQGWSIEKEAAHGTA